MTLHPMALARNLMRLSDDDKLVALAWVERASTADADETDRGLLANLLDGVVEIAAVVNGVLQYRLTEEGKAQADELIANHPEAQRMIANLLDATRVDGPKDPQ